MAPVDPIATEQGDDSAAHSRRWRRTRATLSWVATIAVGLLVIWAVSWSGLSVNLVKSGSMQPTYMYHDLAVAVSPKLKPPAVGEVAIVAPEMLGVVMDEHMHRIVAVAPGGGWITRGDANPQNDPWVIPPDGVRAVAVVRIPTQWLQEQKWIIGAVFGAFLLLMLWPRSRSLAVDLTPVNISDVRSTSATLDVGANPELVDAAHWSFDISEDPDLPPGTTRSVVPLEASGPGRALVAVDVTDLTPGKVYYVRARAVVGGYEVLGITRSFTARPDETEIR